MKVYCICPVWTNTCMQCTSRRLAPGEKVTKDEMKRRGPSYRHSLHMSAILRWIEEVKARKVPAEGFDLFEYDTHGVTVRFYVGQIEVDETP